MESAPQVGADYRWTPSAFTACPEDKALIRGLTAQVDGRVIYINREHHYFRAEGSFPGGVIRECFKY